MVLFLVLSLIRLPHIQCEVRIDLAQVKTVFVHVLWCLLHVPLSVQVMLLGCWDFPLLDVGVCTSGAWNALETQPCFLYPSHPIAGTQHVHTHVASYHATHSSTTFFFSIGNDAGNFLLQQLKLHPHPSWKFSS